MITIQSPEIQERVAGWETELKAITNDDTIRLMVTREPDISFTLEEIAKVVMHVTGVPYEKVVSKIRRRNLVQTRHLISYYARKVSNVQWLVIGHYLGGRDHTTAIHGYNAVVDLLDCGDAWTVKAVGMINQYLEEIKSRMRN